MRVLDREPRRCASRTAVPDVRIAPSQALRMALRLEELDPTHELQVLAGEGHTLGGRSRLRDSLVVDWFRRHALQ